jgi:ABC-type polysaccharide/polyol phosphate transport system ATPase subunit
MRNPVTLDQPAAATAVSADRSGAPTVIEVRDVEKTFRIPDQRIDSLKERITRPLTRIEYRELHALQRVSFDVRRGEFFGIVGRNGSGKSTLLKIMASIYRPDAGRVRMAGRVAPFIELGVGFNPELTARENVVLNGVLMGLSRREAARRLGAVIDFAELQEFADLKLKNYSSGMMVRLAFAVMVQADADIMLIDEVLAVGDAAFAQKCMDVFHDRRRAGKTIVLVTHDMATVQLLCHRAMLLHEGHVEFVGGPEEAALRYYRLNFDGPGGEAAGNPEELEAALDMNVRVLEATLRDDSGASIENVEQRRPILVDCLVEAARDLNEPVFLFHVLSDDGIVISAFEHEAGRPVRRGQRLRLRGQIENRFVAGRYFLDCWVRPDREETMVGLQGLRVLRFVVYGTAPRHGVFTLEAEMESEVEDVR